MKKKSKKQVWTLKRALPYILLIGSAIGAICSFALIVENIALLKHPTESLLCDINPVISCGSVMKTWQSEVFGFPNPIAGLVSFTFLGSVGLAMFAGATFKKWFWWLVQACLTGSVAFVVWFQYESIFKLHELCPFCMTVWAVTIPIFWYVTLYNLREGHIKTPAKLKSVVAFAQKRHDYILAAWFLIIILIILNHFWYYWQTLI